MVCSIPGWRFLHWPVEKLPDYRFVPSGTTSVGFASPSCRFRYRSPGRDLRCASRITLSSAELLSTHYQWRRKSHSTALRARSHQLPNFTSSSTEKRILITHPSRRVAVAEVLCFFGQISSRHGSGSLGFGQNEDMRHQAVTALSCRTPRRNWSLVTPK